LDKAYEKKVTTTPGAIIGTNTVFVTNTVPVTDAAGNVTDTQIITPVQTFQYAPPVSVTNLVPRASVQTGVELVGSLPVPFAGTAAALLGLLYSGYAAVRNKKTSVALVKGVEAFRTWAQTTPEGRQIDSKLVSMLKEHQEISGVLNEVAHIVNEHTADTVKPSV
jgi:hypothetical protein